MQEQLSASEIYTALETFALNDYARHTGFMKRAPQKITPKNFGAGFLKTIVKVMSGSPKQGESIGTGHADDDERKQARLASTQTLIKIPQQQGEQNAPAHQHGFIDRHVRKRIHADARKSHGHAKRQPADDLKLPEQRKFLLQAFEHGTVALCEK